MADLQVFTDRVGPPPKNLRPQAYHAWEAHLYVFYVSWRLREAHLYVFYVSWRVWDAPGGARSPGLITGNGSPS